MLSKPACYVDVKPTVCDCILGSSLLATRRVIEGREPAWIYRILLANLRPKENPCHSLSDRLHFLGEHSTLEAFKYMKNYCRSCKFSNINYVHGENITFKIATPASSRQPETMLILRGYFQCSLLYLCCSIF